MPRFSPIRFAAVAGIVLSASLTAQSPQATPAAPAQAQSNLPATLPTTPEPPLIPLIPLTPSQLPPKHAQVTYANGTLSISADNASLNQILRQIATDTGMKITGGVAEERVFGQYGPDNPAQVLAALLDGTGSNMILVHRDADAPAELILTPRQGGPTPPNPTATAFDNRPNSPERSEPREVPPVQGMRPELGSSVPAPPPVTPGANPDAPNGTNPANSSQPDSPNGVKTPQQIYEQLQRMRQQQQQQTTQPQ
jgi:hypothetical protein